MCKIANNRTILLYSSITGCWDLPRHTTRGKPKWGRQKSLSRQGLNQWSLFFSDFWGFSYIPRSNARVVAGLRPSLGELGLMASVVLDPRPEYERFQFHQKHQDITAVLVLEEFQHRVLRLTGGNLDSDNNKTHVWGNVFLPFYSLWGISVTPTKSYPRGGGVASGIRVKH